MSEEVKQIVEEFSEKNDALKRDVDTFLETGHRELAAGYEVLQEDSRFVTLMLFGRTRAGKSTTMEALTRGKGDTIGVGRQHTTRKVKAYYFPRPSDDKPPAEPALRIVDTPGIEGFDGEDLGAMAEEFLTRADHLVFLLTDDKATAGELDRFGQIGTHGKPITAVLNVKAGDEDLVDLIECPEEVFRQEELEGHLRRIAGYLADHFKMAPPPVIPLHARAAWLARSGNQSLPDGLHPRSIERASRIADLERRVEQVLLDDAVLARLRAPRDLLSHHLWGMSETLRPHAGTFRKIQRDADSLRRQLKQGSEKARRRIIHQFDDLRNRYRSVSDAVPGLVDTVIADRGDGKTLAKAWEGLLKSHGVSDAVEWFVEKGRQEYRRQLTEDIRVAGVDPELVVDIDADELLADYQAAHDRTRRVRYAGGAARAVAGAAGGGLALWAVANFWNPTGWAAALGAVVVGGAGIVAEKGARAAADAVTKRSRREVLRKRGEIEKHLRDQLWANYRDARRVTGDWLDETRSLLDESARQAANPISRAAGKQFKAIVRTLDALRAIRSKLDHGLLEDLLIELVPEVARGRIIVTSVARTPGYCTKVLVQTSETGRCNALGACIGKKGVRIQALRFALNGDRVDIVDGGADMEQKVVQALGASPKMRMRVEPSGEGKRGVPNFTIRAPKRSRRSLVGAKGINVRMAEQLLGVELKITEARR